MRAKWLSVTCMCICSIGSAVPAAHGQELRRSGFVGVSVAAIPSAVRADLGLPDGLGVMVQAVVDGGSAKAAAIQPNDVITQIGDHTVRDVTDFVDTVRVLRAGDARALHVRRGPAELIVDITIRPRPFEAA